MQASWDGLAPCGPCGVLRHPSSIRSCPTGWSRSACLAATACFCLVVAPMPNGSLVPSSRCRFHGFTGIGSHGMGALARPCAHRSNLAAAVNASPATQA